MSDYTTAQLAELKSNYSKGVAEISRGDERIKFRSLGEMKSLIAEIEASLSPTPITGQHYPSFSKGT